MSRCYFIERVYNADKRAAHLLGPVMQPRKITWNGLQTGAWLFFWGLFKKVVIGDNVAAWADQVFSGSVAWSTGSVVLGARLFGGSLRGTGKAATR